MPIGIHITSYPDPSRTWVFGASMRTRCRTFSQIDVFDIMNYMSCCRHRISSNIFVYCNFTGDHFPVSGSVTTVHQMSSFLRFAGGIPGPDADEDQAKGAVSSCSDRGTGWATFRCACQLIIIWTFSKTRSRSSHVQNL